jgi:hypothetical protein
MHAASCDGSGGIAAVAADGRPLTLIRAVGSLCRSMVRTGVLLSTRAISQPKDHVDEVLHFGDGSAARIYRETCRRDATTDAPVVLVAFRLRFVRAWRHALFRAESLLNTPLFVGFLGSSPSSGSLTTATTSTAASPKGATAVWPTSTFERCGGWGTRVRARLDSLRGAARPPPR